MTNFAIFLEGARAMQVPAIALSVRQPWAWLIVHRHKGIENRSWPTKFRGPFLVHASKTVDLDGYEWVRSRFPEIALPHRNGFDVGGYVGVATLSAMFPPEPDASAACDPWRDPAQWGHYLENAHAFPKMLPDVGQLGYFKVHNATRLAIAGMLRNG